MGKLVKKFLFSLFLSLAVGLLSLHAEVLDFAFRVGQFRVDSSYKNNSRAILNISSATGHVDIYAYCSPDGSLSRNRQLAKLRAASVKELAQSQNSSLTFNIYLVDEDWDGVASYLRHCKAEWAKDALEIVNNSEASSRKELLQELWVGEAWDHLMKYCFPSLRRVSASFSNVPKQSWASSQLVVFFANSSSAPNIDNATRELLKDILNSAKSKTFLPDVA